MILRWGGRHFLARGLGPLGYPCGSRTVPAGGWVGLGEEAPLKVLRILKYRTSFLNRNWLKLYHVRHDASHRRYVQWSMIFYSWCKALLRLQYEEQQSNAFACSWKICVILFNAHYQVYPFPIPSLKRERTNSYVWNIRKGEMDMSQTEWKRTGEKYSHDFQKTMTSALKLINNW